MSRKKRASRCYRASVLVISMIFTLIFSALAISMASMSGGNVQMASNHHNINATMNFDREGSTKIPAGFDLYRELDYDPSTYSET